MLKNTKIVFVIGILSLLVSSFSIAGECEKKREIPFEPGEKLHFEVWWGFIRAGEATLQILPMEEVNGEKVFSFLMSARTTSFVDVFYKVRDTYESLTDMGMNHAIHYRKKSEGHRKKEVTVRFDWERMETQYVRTGEDWEPVPLIPGSFDPLSVFYAFRTYHLEVGKELSVPVSDGKKCVMGLAKVLKRERIKIKMGEYDAFLIEPDLKDIGGVFEKSDDAKIEVWVTADDKKIPLRIKSKVIVGSFVAELASVEGLEPIRRGTNKDTQNPMRQN
jgi:hypothetical protein